MGNYIHTLFFIIAIAIIFYVGKSSIHSLVHRIGRDKGVPYGRIQYVRTVLILGWSTLAFLAVGFVIGIGYAEVGLFFGSIFAVVGVALFAQWSILSNATASVVIFFFFPFRLGDYVKIIDGDNSVEGRVKEITLFHVILERENGVSTYPNAMIFQKAIEIGSPTETDDMGALLNDDK